jgi:VWFA-related protein
LGPFIFWTLAALIAAQAVQTPAFKSGVELVVVDVQVVDGHGYPIDTLTPDAFDVTIDGHHRRVVSADLTRYAGRSASKASDPAPAPAGLAVPPKASRMFIITRDHERAKKDLEHIVGLLDIPFTRYKLSVSEVVHISAGDGQVLGQVVARECGRGGTCKPEIMMEANALSNFFEMQAINSLGGLRTIVRSLANVPGRKTLVVVSGGLLASDRIGGRPDIRLETFAFARDAAASNVNMYVLHMDNSFLDAYSANGAAKNFVSQMRDSGALSLGLELVAGAAGGSLVHVEGTMPERAFDRVARETSAYYLRGVEPADADRDGQTHHIHVDVKQHGATVRSRMTVMIPVARK